MLFVPVKLNAISDERIKTNINNLELGLNIITKIRPVTYNYKNKNRMGINIRIGLIAQEIKEFLPEIVHQSYGQIDNINTEFNINDIKIDNNKVTLQLNDLDIKDGDKIEICDISQDGITSNIRTVDILDISNNEFSFIDSKINNNNLFISGKHVDDFHTIDYQALVPILINSVKELNDEIKILKDKINILESNKI